MKISLKVFLVFSLSLVMMGTYSLSNAQEWKAFYENEKERFYFDNTSLERLDNKSFRIWQKITEKQTGTDEVDKVKSQIEINCSQKIFKTLSLIEYDTISGKALPEQRYGEDQPWVKFSLESKYGALYDNFCP
ncbi:MAG: hypothetical protein PHU49_12290 [Syntrophorhabdaceae bacterium]|nr:hypothetical protein [Syntrophorhabdaceae bacterium]MDD5244787.1 hypothetical protein [Syntrophorhabdaceae bacterium]